MLLNLLLYTVELHYGEPWNFTWVAIERVDAAADNLCLGFCNIYSFRQTNSSVICRPFARHIVVTRTRRVTLIRLMLWRQQYCVWHITGTYCNLFSFPLSLSLSSRKRYDNCFCGVLQVQLHAAFKRFSCRWLRGVAWLISGSKHGCHC